MASGFVHYTRCLLILILTVFVDWGDGRWKKKDKENLQDDIALFRKMADKIEHKMEEFYDEYPNERLNKDDIENINYSYVSLGELERNWTRKYNMKKQDILFTYSDETFKVPSNVRTTQEIEQKTKIIPSKNNIMQNPRKEKNNSWPKFEDILLAMGRKYDWKNDRWIKVKRKLMDLKIDKINQPNSINFHVKHKFYYRIVKLKKSKNKRNVVVAVSAVR